MASVPPVPPVRRPVGVGLTAFVLAALAVGACVAPESGAEGAYGETGTLDELLEMATAEGRPIDGEPGSVDYETDDSVDPAERTDGIDEVERELVESYADGTRATELDGPGETPTPSRPRNPYLTFGGRIAVHGDGRITKPYPLPPGRGQRMLDLLVLFAGQGLFPVQVIDPKKPPAPDPNVVQTVLLKGWDAELFQNLRNFPPADKEVPVADWLVVTSSFELLEEVEYFMELFGSGVRQFEIEAKIVEITESEAFDWGVADGDYAFPGSPAGQNTLLDTIGFAFPNTAGSGEEAILSLGAIQDGSTFTAILEVIERWDNVSIISQPRVAVREGGRAEILNTEELPFFNVKSISDQGTFNATLDFKEVGVKLFIVPRVVGTETLALAIDIEASQQAGTLTTVAAGGGAGVETPIIAKRSVNTIVYIEEGQALILGGLTTERQTERERKLPILGDIPLLGYLFKSKFTEQTRSHVLFFLRPRLLEGSDFNRDF